MIKIWELVFDTVYLIPVDNIKQWYTINEKIKKQIVRLNIVIFSQVKGKSINDVALPDRKSNKFRGDATRLGTI